MASDADTQSVASDTDAAASAQAAEAQGAQDESLDSLLAEWEKEVETRGSDKSDASSKGGQQGTEKSGGQGVPDDVSELVSYVRQRQAEEVAERTNREIEEAVNHLREGWDDAPHPRLLKGELYRAASEDPRFLEAFQHRHQSPERWNRILKAQQRELQSELGGKVDREATADRDTVTAAVRSASKAPPPKGGPSEADIARMSDAEFERFRRGL